MQVTDNTKKDDLRYGICLWRIDTAKPSSIAFYASSLIREWSKMWPGRFLLFYPSSSTDFFRRIEGSERFVGRGLNSLDEIYRYRDEIDILYTPYWWSEIGIDGLPQAHFIPDIGFLVYGSEDLVGVRDMRRKSCYGMGSSPLIVTPSHYTKRTLLKTLGFAEENIRVVYHGAHSIFSDEADLGTRPVNLAEEIKDYLFYPAISATRKNHLGLLNALVILREQYGLQPHCVLAGPLLEGHDTIDVPREIVKRGLNKTVHHLGSISLSELKYLYTRAKALVFPSQFEGFGIPVLEAMKVGCPVIASNQTSIPEVAGEAALYFDPYVATDIAETIFQFYQDRSLARVLASKGKDRSVEFSDQLQALETKAILDEAYWKSIAETSRRRSIIHQQRDPHPLLSVIVQFKRSSAGSVLSALETLVADMGQMMEIIWIVSDNDLPDPETLSSLSHAVRQDSSFQSTVLRALRKAQGSFVFLSRGDAIPLGSFVLCLAAMVSAGGPDSEADIIHGDAFLRKDCVEKTCAGRTIHTIRSEYEAEYCCQYLPFVIRKEALVHAVSHYGFSMRSFGDVARIAFSVCSRQRLFVPVSEKILHIRPRENPYSDIHIERVQREFKCGTAVFRLLNHPILRLPVLRLLDELLSSQSAARHVVRNIVGTLMRKAEWRDVARRR
jgi:glycosyltransferase involved in cell wall biosynthesis